jgi:CoA:oxalate CoA-transferase
VQPLPLDGVRVLDLTTFLSGPFCTQILADLGADVVKLEPPEGDASRHIPPYFVDGDSAYYLAHNRNKRSIAVDLKTAAGLQVARDLIGRSDVVVENFRPGVAARLGLDPVTLRAAQPQLIWASISGFGQHGPWRDRPAYDIVVQPCPGS